MTTRINPIAPRLKWDVLSPAELERIHEATLEIMEDVGIRFPSDKALGILERNGCEVDRATQVAKDLGVDMVRLAKDIDSGESRPFIAATMRAADALRIGGTPAFVVGDGVIVGAVGQESLASAVKSVRTCGKTAC